MFKIAVLQHAMAPDIDANLDTAERLMKEAAEAGARLVVFPELQLSPFFPKRRARPRTIPPLNT
jgi:predicted amidohydrolase